jgi:ABC-type branched-subunit amino acid transport system substrate-binding protein
MKSSWKVGISCFLSLVLVAVFILGCGGGDSEKRVTVTIGALADFTGPGAPAEKNITYITQDIARYYNDENLIPGVKVNVAAYDTQFDPARILLGYDWCKNKGAKVIITLEPSTADALKPFAERDKIVIAAMGANLSAFDPPGWVFCFSNPNPWAMKTLMKWVNENDWEGPGIPKIGLAGWSIPDSLGSDRAIKEYIRSHPGQFDYVGAYLAPSGTMTFNIEADKLKDCDYVTSFGMPIGYFLKDFRAKGYKGKMVDPSGMGCYTGFFAELVGWEGLDGTLTANQSMLWDESTPIVDLVKKLLQQYRSSEANQIKAGAVQYVGPAHQVIAIFEVLHQAIEEVGAKNLTGQAFFDAAMNYKTTSDMWKGYYPEWGFSQTKRYLIDHIVILEYSAQEQALLRITDWLPLIKE